MSSNAADLQAAPKQLIPDQSGPAQSIRAQSASNQSDSALPGRARYCPAWQGQPKPLASRSKCRNYRDCRLPPGRLCHDCAQPTSNYRCDKCLAAWRCKHGISEDLL